jgi:hypothetical protein
MATKIVTKFTIGTEEGISTLLFLTVATAREKFQGKVSDEKLEDYIRENFNKEVLTMQLNSLSNQYLVVYVDDEPAGYARVTSKGIRPDFFGGKTLIRIADFSVLAKYDNLQVIKLLFEKCISITNMQQIVWISECESNPHLNFFESYGFKKNTDINAPHELSLPAVYLVKEKASS